MIYFPEIYILVLTTTICHLFLNNNILTQSIIFPQLFSKYVFSRIKNKFPIEKNEAMIRLFA